MEKIKGSELAWEASRTGYQIFYRNKPVGGVACKGRGSPVNQKYYNSEAKAAVKDIVNGVGDPKFLEEILKIQKEDLV